MSMFLRWEVHGNSFITCTSWHRAPLCPLRRGEANKIIVKTKKLWFSYGTVIKSVLHFKQSYSNMGLMYFTLLKWSILLLYRSCASYTHMHHFIWFILSDIYLVASWCILSCRLYATRKGETAKLLHKKDEISAWINENTSLERYEFAKSQNFVRSKFQILL